MLPCLPSQTNLKPKTRIGGQEKKSSCTKSLKRIFSTIWNIVGQLFSSRLGNVWVKPLAILKGKLVKEKTIGILVEIALWLGNFLIQQYWKVENSFMGPFQYLIFGSCFFLFKLDVIPIFRLGNNTITWYKYDTKNNN